MIKARMPSLSVCFLKNNTVVDYKSYGSIRLFDREKPTINTVYAAHSITKTVTGTAIMQLYEKGLFDLDDDVSNYLDFNVRNPNHPDIPITFKMLLSHQASLMSFGNFKDVWLNEVFKKNKENYPYPMIKELLLPEGNLYKEWIWEDYTPGEKANYSNVDIMLLEYLVETLSNQDYKDYCQENIFNPLNMTNTSFNYADYNKNQLAYLYQSIGPFYIRLPFNDMHYGAAGMKTTCEDLSHFLIAHMNGGIYKDTRILNESTIKIMHTDHYPNSNICHGGQRFGLSWAYWPIGKEGLIFEGHSGHGIGGFSLMAMNSSENIGFIFFTNNHIVFQNPIVKSAWSNLRKTLIEKSQSY